MDKKLHIIITSEEGQPKSFVFIKKNFILTLQCTCAFLLVLTIMSLTCINYMFKSAKMRTTVVTLEKDLSQTHSKNLGLEEQLVALNQEKEALLNDAVSELNQKSKLIESILTTVGVDIKTKESPDHSGGPYTSLDNQNHDDLLFKAGRYVETIQSIPLGVPVAGSISSKFGRRIDPLKKKPAFHEGVDIRGKRGTKIKATADGVVSQRGYNNGYGWYLVINHQNGFKTKFGHLKKILVKRGQKITRGQVVALLGSSGRSTGPHVHYELIHKNKVINPYKFMNIGRLLKKSMAANKTDKHKRG